MSAATAGKVCCGLCQTRLPKKEIESLGLIDWRKARFELLYAIYGYVLRTWIAAFHVCCLYTYFSSALTSGTIYKNAHVAAEITAHHSWYESSACAEINAKQLPVGMRSQLMFWF